MNFHLSLSFVSSALSRSCSCAFAEVAQPPAGVSGQDAAAGVSVGEGDPTYGRADMWAALLARIYEVFPLACPNCKGDMRLIA